VVKKVVLSLFAALAIGVPVALAQNFTGTNGPDFIVGTNSDDVIKALAGNDVAIGQGGDDDIDGGEGDDLPSGCPERGLLRHVGPRQR
jgi:Ca2+-binding RTX toxin-like protein